MENYTCLKCSGEERSRHGLYCEENKPEQESIPEGQEYEDYKDQEIKILQTR